MNSEFVEVEEKVAGAVDLARKSVWRKPATGWGLLD
jgi:hypothetical protein